MFMVIIISIAIIVQDYSKEFNCKSPCIFSEVLGDYHYYFTHLCFGIFIAADFAILTRKLLKISFKEQKKPASQSNAVNKTVPLALNWFITLHAVVCVAVSYAYLEILKPYEQTFFRTQTFIYVLYYIGLNCLFSILFIGIFYIFYFVGRRNKGDP